MYRKAKEVVYDMNSFLQQAVDKYKSLVLQEFRDLKKVTTPFLTLGVETLKLFPRIAILGNMWDSGLGPGCIRSHTGGGAGALDKDLQGLHNLCQTPMLLDNPLSAFQS